MTTASFSPRLKQKEVLAFRRGRMGVSAVPGSGKTWTLSLLAANLLLENRVTEDQEVLVVTLTNSAVDNFVHRVDGFLKESGRKHILVPNYRVRTLHGLAHDIVRERPSLVGLAESFSIIDERAAAGIRSEVARAWLLTHPDELDEYLDPTLDESRAAWVLREKIPELLDEIALSFIRTAKDLRLTPEILRQRLDEIPFSLPLVEMGWNIYHDYQRALAYRGAVDFDDLIRLALIALNEDKELLQGLRNRWPYILEDEAQDSSQLQEQILTLLVGEDGNWVRVGDPNQAIYETFTTASPEHLRRFMASPFVQKGELPNSGRSTQSIIWLANRLVKWVMEEHPLADVRDALVSPPEIEPTPPGDPQPNPPDNPRGIHLIGTKFTAADEIVQVVKSLGKWLPDHPDHTVAILAPTNKRAFEFTDALKNHGLPYNDSLLRSSSSTRTTAGMLGNVLNYLANPDSASRLARALEVWQRTNEDDSQEKEANKQSLALVRKCRQVEDYLWPRHSYDWLEELELQSTNPPLYEHLESFRQIVRRWLGTVLLPIDQIVLTLSQDLFKTPTDLAIAHKLAVLLRQASELKPDWRLAELTQELAIIARNERRFLGFSEDDTGFDPERYRGVVVVATMHKAKGLEWDRVYLVSVNNYDFPTGMPYDQFISEKWYLQERVNLEAETRAQLTALFPERQIDTGRRDPRQWPEPGEATAGSRLDYIRERLRLLYVGITRARQELVITWNTGQKGNLQPAVPFLALSELWEEHLHEPAG